MLKGVPIGQFVPGRSVVHRLDPRTKIVLTALFITVLFVARGAGGYLAVAAFTAVAVLLSGIRFSLVLRSMRPLLFIIGLTVLLHAFMTAGEPVFSLGPLTATRQGLTSGGLMAVRLALLIITTSLLTFTTSPIDLTDGLERLMAPFARIGVPAHELAMMMTIALRFIPTLMEEADKIMKAQMARGADFESGNIVQRARSLVPLLVPLFVSAFRRADELALAMEARCYRGGKDRTRMRTLTLTSADVYAGAAAGVLTVGVVLLRYWR